MAITSVTSFEVGGDYPSGNTKGEPGTFDSIAKIGYCVTNENASYARTGTRSIRLYPGSGQNGYLSLASIYNYLHFGIYIVTLPSQQRVLVGTAYAANIVEVRLNASGTLSYYSYGSLLGTTTTALQTGQWYWIGVRMQSGASSSPLLQVDGTTEITGTHVGGGQNPYLGFSGTESTAVEAYIDDILLDDSGFVGPSYISLLLPAADVDIGAYWQGGGGGTSNLYQGIDGYIPWTGSSSETDATNVAHLGNNSGGPWNYNVRLQNYSTAGLDSSSIVRAVVAFIRHAEHASTGSKTANLKLGGNPTDGGTPTSFTFGNNAGAHGSDVTETSLWAPASAPIVQGPTVDTSSGPQVNIQRTAGETRQGCVEWVGAYVVWWPGGPPTTDAPAGLASATGSALGPARTEIASFAPLAQATGAGLAATVSAGKFVSAPLATATGSALTPALGKGPTAGLATASGSALAASAVPERRIAAPTATGSGSALAPAARPEARAPAGLAGATGSALQGAAALGARAGLAQASGAVPGALVAIGGVAPAAGATGSALAGITALASFASVASGAGAGLDATVQTSQLTHTEVYPDTATAAGAALAATGRATIFATAGIATAAGSALAAAGRVEARAQAGLATGSGSGLAPTVSLGGIAGLASAAGSGLTASVTTSSFVYVDAALAQATGLALAPHLYQPVWVSPDDQTQMSSTPTLVFTMPTMASAMHFHLQLDTAASFDSGDLREAKTNTDQSGWTYWDGGAWQAVPAGGVPSQYGGNQARYVVGTELAGGTWYRRIRVGT